MSEGCLTVLMTSLSVLTPEGWMMVALQGTAATGGLTDKILGRYFQVCDIDSVSLKPHKQRGVFFFLSVSLYGPSAFNTVKYFLFSYRFASIYFCYCLCVMTVPSRGALL